MGLALNIQQQIFTCPYCGAPFNSQADLDAHIASEHLAAPITGWLEWLQAYWPWLVSGGLGTALVISLSKKRRK